MDRLLADRDAFLGEVKDRLEQAQQYHKRHYDAKHRDQEYAVGQWVWLRLLHRLMASLSVQGRSKLGPKYYGPYQVVERINEVAYRLQLPEKARIHDMFHVGVLKPFFGEPPVAAPPLPQLCNGRVVPQPEKVIKSRLNRGCRELLVQWQGTTAADANWVPLEEFQREHPTYQLATSCFLRRGEMS